MRIMIMASLPARSSAAFITPHEQNAADYRHARRHPGFSSGDVAALRTGWRGYSWRREIQQANTLAEAGSDNRRWRGSFLALLPAQASDPVTGTVPGYHSGVA